MASAAGKSEFGLRFAAEQAIARLYDKGVPETYRQILSHLPLTVPVVHVAWSGDMLDERVAFPNRTARSLRTRFACRAQAISHGTRSSARFALPYGTAEARLPSGENQLVVFGQVEDGLEQLAVFCRARRFEGIGEIHIEAL